MLKFLKKLPHIKILIRQLEFPNNLNILCNASGRSTSELKLKQGKQKRPKGSFHPFQMHRLFLKRKKQHKSSTWSCQKVGHQRIQCKFRKNHLTLLITKENPIFCTVDKVLCYEIALTRKKDNDRQYCLISLLWPERLTA